MPPSCENPWRINILFPDMSEVQALAIRWDTEVSNRINLSAGSSTGVCGRVHRVWVQNDQCPQHSAALLE